MATGTSHLGRRGAGTGGASADATVPNRAAKRSKKSSAIFAATPSISREPICASLSAKYLLHIALAQLVRKGRTSFSSPELRRPLG